MSIARVARSRSGALMPTLRAKPAGTMPISTSITRPTPFCPSFDPCAKLTPVHVPISTARIHRGGGWVPTGARYSCGSRISRFAASNSSAATVKPISGEISSASPTSPAFPQLTPAPNSWPGSSEFARPTPTIAPMSVCELEAGSPRYQVPRFQTIAATSSASNIASPAPVPLATSRSTGSRLMMLIATAIPPTNTPRKLHTPDRITAVHGRSERV